MADGYSPNRKCTLPCCCATKKLLASKKRTTLACAPQLLHGVAHWHAESLRLWRCEGKAHAAQFEALPRWQDEED